MKRVVLPSLVSVALLAPAAPAQAAIPTTPADWASALYAETQRATEQTIHIAQQLAAAAGVPMPAAPAEVPAAQPTTSSPVTLAAPRPTTSVAVKGIPKTTAVKGIPKTTAVKGIPKTTVAPTTTATAGTSTPTTVTTSPAVAAEPTPATTNPLEVPVNPEEQMIIRPRIDAPNHHWATDPLSMVMAATFGPVLHRVDGSWFNAPDVPREAYAAEARGKALFGPGTPIFIGDNSICTLTAAGYDKEGNKVGITAGHCGKPGDPVVSADSWPMGEVGYFVGKDTVDDWGVIRFTDKAEVSRSYNGVTLTDVAEHANDGDIVCKTGVSTGTTCGPQFVSDRRVSLAQYCSGHGDSGGPVYHNGVLIGFVGSGVFAGSPLPCTTPLQGPLFAPAATHHMGVVLAEITKRDGYGAGFVLPDSDGKDPRADK